MKYLILNLNKEIEGNKIIKLKEILKISFDSLILMGNILYEKNEDVIPSFLLSLKAMKKNVFIVNGIEDFLIIKKEKSTKINPAIITFISSLSKEYFLDESASILAVNGIPDNLFSGIMKDKENAVIDKIKVNVFIHGNRNDNECFEINNQLVVFPQKVLIDTSQDIKKYIKFLS